MQAAMEGQAAPTPATTSTSPAVTSEPATLSSRPNAAGGLSSIIVALRKRPKIESREKDENDIVRCESDTVVAVYEPRTKLDLTRIIEPNLFSFDHVFSEQASNVQVYQECCQPLLQNVRDGGGAVVFAFGQTGSGKTYTMLGKDSTPGLYSLAVTELLQMTDKSTLSASFYEVYGSKLYDLLNDRAEVKMLQDEYSNIRIVGLTERKVCSVEDVNTLMTSGQLLRAIGTTHANDRSSRSHAVLEIKVELAGAADTHGRITFVDLAGSERASDTAESTARTRREGAEINKSLLALKECIRAMSLRQRHIPFRGSKLTQILRESFVGRCKTCVIATISPCQSHCEDTLNTLRYANRIKELKSPGAALLTEAPIPCQNCGLPIFVGDRHVCRRQVVQCPHCRQELDKSELDGHLQECKECPLRCPHCTERVVRGELERHNRRCPRLPVRCASCTQLVPRNAMDKHVLHECAAVKKKCRFCAQLFPRATLEAHEEQCDWVKVPCSYCLQLVRKHRLEAHLAGCALNPNVAPRAATSTGAVSTEQQQSQPQVPSRSAKTSVARESMSSTSNVTSAALSRAASSSHQLLLAPPRARLPQLSPSGLTPSQRDASEDEPEAVTPVEKMQTRKYTVLPDVVASPSAANGRLSPSPSAGSTASSHIKRSGRLSARSDMEYKVVCPYTRYGCGARVTRLNLQEHLAKCVAEHLELVTLYADKVDQQNAELRRLVVRRSNAFK